MAAEHDGWQKFWQREPSGSLLHVSGLRVLLVRNGDYVEYHPDTETLAAHRQFELSNGMTPFLIERRLLRLIFEASLWREPQPKDKS